MRAVNWALVNAAVSIVLLVVSFLLFSQAVWLHAQRVESNIVPRMQHEEGLRYEHRVNDVATRDPASALAQPGTTQDASAPVVCYPLDTIDANGRIRYVASGLRYDF